MSACQAVVEHHHPIERARPPADEQPPADAGARGSRGAEPRAIELLTEVRRPAKRRRTPRVEPIRGRAQHIQNANTPSTNNVNFGHGGPGAYGFCRGIAISCSASMHAHAKNVRIPGAYYAGVWMSNSKADSDQSRSGTACGSQPLLRHTAPLVVRQSPTVRLPSSRRLRRDLDLRWEFSKARARSGARRGRSPSARADQPATTARMPAGLLPKTTRANRRQCEGRANTEKSRDDVHASGATCPASRSSRPRQRLTTQPVGSRGKIPPVVIGEPLAPPIQLLPQNPILLDQVRPHLPLPSVQPAGDSEQQHVERCAIWHGQPGRLRRGTLRTAFPGPEAPEWAAE